MTVYVPLWFKIKKEKYCIDGAKHLFWFITATRFLNTKLLEGVNDNIQTNGYFSHSEYVLFAMLADENQEYRKKAVEKILLVRQNKLPTDKQLRTFFVPKIRSDASNYTKMINWKSNFTEPPLTKHLSDNEIQNFIVNQSTDNELFQFHCHNQAVKRHVKLVKECSIKICNKNSHDMLAQSVIKSRKKMLKYDTKKEFVV